MTFTSSVSEWINKTNAIGLYVKRGKYGETYAHKDLAFKFASAVSLVFKLYLIKEFQRLKEEENNSRQIEWNAKPAVSLVFKLYLIKEFQRLKEEENNSRQIEWNAKHFLRKSNYLIQTDAVKNYLLSTDKL